MTTPAEESAGVFVGLGLCQNEPQMEENLTFSWQIGFIIFFGLVIYSSVAPALGIGVAVLVHLAAVGLYLGCLLSFGPDSKIEMGVVLSICVILLTILLPVYQRAHSPREPKHKSALGQSQIVPTPHFDFGRIKETPTASGHSRPH